MATTDDRSVSNGDGQENGEDTDMDDTDTEDGDSIEAESSEEEAPELVVRVVGPAGEPIEDAIVRGEGESEEGDSLEFGGETDDEGIHTEEIDRGTYTIEVDHGEYEAATVEHDHDDESEVTIELASPVAVAELSVTVTDSAGEPIEGAIVRGEGDAHDVGIPLEFEGETDDDGVYRDVLYENAYTISVDHEDYHPETVEHVHDGDGDVAVSLALVEGGVPDASRITVVVVDEGGSPIEGAEVIGRGAPHEADIPLQFSGETNSQGRHPDVIYHNDYRIQADHSDYAGAIVRHVHDGPADVVVELDSGPDEMPVAITAVDPDTGGAIEGADVRLVRTSGADSWSDEAETGSDGVALFEVEAGEYNVLVADDLDLAHIKTDYAVTVEDGPVQEAFEAVREPENCVLTVEIVDSETGGPVEGAQFQADITVENIDDMALAAGETDGNGITEVRGWCGEWEPAAGYEGYHPADPGAIDVTSDDSLTIELDPWE